MSECVDSPGDPEMDMEDMDPMAYGHEMDDMDGMGYGDESQGMVSYFFLVWEHEIQLQNSNSCLRKGLAGVSKLCPCVEGNKFSIVFETTCGSSSANQ